MKGTHRGRPSKQLLTKSLAWSVICINLLSPNKCDSYKLLFHRPHQSSQYDAFPSQARDPCFTRLAKMRRNTVTYWHEADIANRETCSFLRLNDAFRKTFLQAAKKKSRKLSDHGKQLRPRALISNLIVFYDRERIMGWGRGEGGGEWGSEKDVNSIRQTSFFVYCSLLGVFCTKSIVRKNKTDWSRTEEASNKTVAKNL